MAIIGTRLGPFIVILFALFGTPACANEALKAVASFSILADFVQQVGGSRVQVAPLVPPGSDVHVFSPSPGDARRISAAQIVFINGMGLEGWIDRLIREAGGRPREIVSSRGVAAIDDQDGSARHVDPHAWQDVAQAKIYVANIRDALIAVDPQGGDNYRAAASAYLSRLDGLDHEIRAAIAQIPPDRRKVITTHDAFAYFQRAYGITFIAPEGVSTETEPSAADVARITRQIRAQRIPAVFLEHVADNRITLQIARETGSRIGGELYADSLSGPDGPAATYMAMMRHNVSEFVAALAPEAAGQ